jgi:small subunit ribosomal protein S30e
MGKQHGSIQQAGKVRNQTPKVAKKDKSKEVRGRARLRKIFNQRFLAVQPDSKQKLKLNSQMK